MNQADSDLPSPSPKLVWTEVARGQWTTIIGPLHCVIVRYHSTQWKLYIGSSWDLLSELTSKEPLLAQCEAENKLREFFEQGWALTALPCHESLEEALQRAYDQGFEAGKQDGMSEHYDE